MADRNFDDLADRFAKRIHDSLKGKIRRTVIWRDLNETIPKLQQNSALTIADVGSGLGQFAIELAQKGHHVLANDLSKQMQKVARENAQKLQLEEKIQWHLGPYQTLPANEPLDLILCHALLEWLDEPHHLLPSLQSKLKSGGHLSLCFYNPAGLIYRNLIRGNFRYIDNLQTTKSDSGSLTPQNPQDLEQVTHWLEESGFIVEKLSGIRVFTDYVQNKLGGNQHPEQIIERELFYSDQKPYCYMGRYLHIMAVKR